MRRARLDAELVEVALRAREDGGDLERDVHRHVLVLLEDLDETAAAIQL